MSDPLQQAIELHKAGKLDEADAIYRQALAQQPNSPRVLHMLGTTMIQRRRFAEAIELLQRAAAGAANVAEVHFALADALRYAGRPADAEKAYRRSIEIRPLFPSAHNGLGLALVAQNKIESAIQSWHRAIQLKGDYAEPFANMGAALAKQGKHSEAMAMLRRAVIMSPKFAPARNNLANVLDALDLTDAAILEWREALKLAPKYFDALINLSKALHSRGEHAEAMALLERAVEIKPNDPDARFLRGLERLLNGDLAGGFSDYQFRLQSPDLKLANRTFPQPAWTGEDVSGKTILLHTEQGLGDAIQFIRYAPLLAERGAKVVVECSPDTVSIMRRVKGVSEVIARGGTLPAFDVHASVLSLPMLFGTTLDTIPANVPYIAADEQLALSWADIIASDPPGRRVGLVWSGNPKHINDHNRSILLRMFEALAATPDATFFSLQKGPAEAQLGDSTLKLRLVDHAARLTDFGQTAALLHHLDLVITVDTAVAHLAGAMGKPVWVLLPFVPDWRWMRGRSDSPWYPTMRLFRQPALHDWETVIREIAAALRQQ